MPTKTFLMLSNSPKAQMIIPTAARFFFDVVRPFIPRIKPVILVKIPRIGTACVINRLKMPSKKEIRELLLFFPVALVISIVY